MTKRQETELAVLMALQEIIAEEKDLFGLHAELSFTELCSEA